MGKSIMFTCLPHTIHLTSLNEAQILMLMQYGHTTHKILRNPIFFSMTC